MSVLVINLPSQRGVKHGAPPAISQSWVFGDASEFPDSLYDATGARSQRTGLLASGSHSHIYAYKSGTMAYAVKFFDATDTGLNMWARELDLIAKARDVQTLFVPSAIIQSHHALVMPMMDGTLEDLNGTLDERSIIHIAYALLIAISSIYERTGLYYTDVHPGNVLFWNLRNGVSFWLTDFGALCGSSEHKSTCAVMYQPNFGGLSNECKMLFSWICTVLLVAGVERADVDNMCRRQLSCNSDVQLIETTLAAKMPKLARALINAGIETNEPEGIWVRNLNTQKCLSAFRTAFFVRNMVFETEGTKETMLESRLSFARMEREQIQSAIDMGLSSEPLAAAHSEDMKRYENLLQKTDERIADLESRLQHNEGGLRAVRSAQ